MKSSKIIFIFIFLLTASAGAAQPLRISNGNVTLTLSHNNNEPCIQEAIWNKDGSALFRRIENASGWTGWPADLIAKGTPQDWRIDNDPLFAGAVCDVTHPDMTLRWHVRLFRDADVVRLSMEIINGGRRQQVPQFPLWQAKWDLPGKKFCIDYWQSLSYEPRSKSLEDDGVAVLSSRKYSSDDDPAAKDVRGQLPFGLIRDGKNVLGFSLDWCGGWKAEFHGGAGGIDWKIQLPPEETQLTLNPGESMCGPVVTMFFQRASGEIEQRATWFAQRDRLARSLYPVPPINFPFIYNHWYSVRHDLSAEFIRNQVQAFKGLDFDVFVVDAGWYQSIGDWTASRTKFNAGEFRGALQSARDQDIKIGLWSCPWLVAGDKKSPPPEADRPGFFNRFVKAWALDMAGMDFADRLVNHIRQLRSDYFLDWWKYDQEFLGDSTRHGAMKNIKALQDALAAVRRAFPDLVIENCLSGGRMINGFTDDIASLHWIRDGSGTGMPHGRGNITEAMRAARFLPLHKIERWCNRPDESKDEEELRFYCRSGMIGVWGISADLHKLADWQRQVIAKEAGHYRLLNKLKPGNRFQILSAADKNLQGIVFYGEQVGALVYRMAGQGAAKAAFPLSGVRPDARYRLTDLDRNTSRILSGADLLDTGVPVQFEAGRLSAIYMLEEIRGQERGKEEKVKEEKVSG